MKVFAQWQNTCSTILVCTIVFLQDDRAIALDHGVREWNKTRIVAWHTVVLTTLIPAPRPSGVPGLASSLSRSLDVYVYIMAWLYRGTGSWTWTKMTGFSFAPLVCVSPSFPCAFPLLLDWETLAPVPEINHAQLPEAMTAHTLRTAHRLMIMIFVSQTITHFNTLAGSFMQNPGEWRGALSIHIYMQIRWLNLPITSVGLASRCQSGLGSASITPQPSKSATLTQCRIGVGPTSTTLAQHQSDIGWSFSGGGGSPVTIPVSSHVQLSPVILPIFQFTASCNTFPSISLKLSSVFFVLQKISFFSI